MKAKNMLIKGKQVYLRTVREADLDRLYDLRCDVEALGLYYPVIIPSETSFKADFRETGFWQEDYGILLVCSLLDEQPGDWLGELTFFKSAPYFDGLEIAGRLFDLSHQGQGIMTEALSLVTSLLFAARKINRLELKIMPGNSASKRVAEKCGYRFEGVARGAVFHRGAYQDMEVYSILREEAAPQ